jgi:glycosyltransferase involved in cell wall biosynthesis
MRIDVQILSFKPMLGYGTTELRCVQPADYLREAGWKVSLGRIGDKLPVPCRVLLLHRVGMDSLTARIVRYARSAGARILYDTDDLTFDGELGTAAEAGRIRAAMLSSDRAILSTEFLRERAARFHPDCVVMKNGLSRDFLRAAEAHVGDARATSDRVRLGYFSGSAHHDPDFAIVEPAILRLMRDRPGVDLVVGGKIRVSPAFAEFGPRFRYEPFRPYSEYPSMLRALDVNLVPLDTRSDFANARSELKYIEAGAFAVPSVASPTPAYRQAIASGRNGIICRDDEWHAALCRLVDDASLRRTLGAAARDDIVGCYGPEVRVREWDALVRTEVARKAEERSGAGVLLARAAIASEIALRAARERASRVLKGPRPRAAPRAHGPSGGA